MNPRSLLGLALLGVALAATAVFTTGARPVAADDDEIAGVEWRWQGTQLNDGTLFTPADPSRYTLTLRADGRAAIRADCNTGSRPYTLDGNRIDLGPLITTLIGCPPGSLGTPYLRQLDDVVSYFLKDGDLILELPFDSGAMRFSRPPGADTAAPSADAALLTGVVTYRERIAIPQDSVVTVRIEDTSRADAPAVVIGEQVITQHGQVPISFAVPYDPARIDPAARYTLWAIIEDASGRLLFGTTQAYPVLTGGNPTSDLVVVLNRGG